MLVRCKTWWEYIKVLRWHKSMGHKWKSGSNPITMYSIFFWFDFRDSTTVSLNDRFFFNSKSFFESEGLTVYELYRLNQNRKDLV